MQTEQQRARTHADSQDDTRRIENTVFDQMVTDVLLDVGSIGGAASSVTRRRSSRVRTLRAAALDHERPRAPDRGDGSIPTSTSASSRVAQARQSGLLLQLENVLPDGDPAATSCSIKSPPAST